MATYRLKKDQSGQYYWILKSDKNHKIVAMSSESYSAKKDATDSISWTRDNAKNADFEDQT